MLLPEGLYFFLFLLFQIACPFLQKFSRSALISPPSNIMYIHPYSQSMIKIIVVKLPYILVKPLNTSRYTEKKNDKSSHPACRKHRSRKLFAKSCLCHISPVRKKTVHKIPKNSQHDKCNKRLIRIINSTTLLKNGMCSYIITLILFPNTDNTRELTIANRNITV